MRTSWTLFLLLAMCWNPSARGANASVAEGIADRMTREAIAAGAAGEMQLRQDLLDDAVRVAPDHGPARWARGEMQVGDDWQTIGSIQVAARDSKQLDRYNELRAQASDSPQDHLQLARWCRSNDLDDEARYHWLAVLAANANNREALRALDSVWIEGELVPRGVAAGERTPRYQRRKQNEKWRARIAGWERALAAGGDQATQALAELDAEVDETAIQEFERLATVGRRGSTGTTSECHVQMCIAFVRALGHMPTYKASESLVRLAVLSNDESLRIAAAEQLQDRPKNEYVPLLIEGLAALLESNFAINVSPTGRVQYDHEVFAAGPNGNQIAEVARTGGATLNFVGVQTRGTVRRGVNRVQSIQSQHAREFWAEASQREQQVSATNEARAALNSKIIAALETATGQTLGSYPQAWWDYWYDQNGYESRGSLPSETYRISTSQVAQVATGIISGGGGGGRSECFAAGTLVWTKTGTQAIETLAAGDLVLTMDVETGERCFRPVLSTTRRPPSKLMHIAAGDYQLLSTPGHPFWSDGVGWKMAKELSVGDYIATASGAPLAVRVLANSDVEQEAFNLVVEDNSNYFVGVDGLLSHDNTPRRPELERAGSR